MSKIETAQQFLNQVFERKIESRPSYTLRAFAKDAGVSAAQMSLVLRGKAGLSRKTAMEMSERIGLSKTEREFFLALVESQYSRSKTRRSSAHGQLDNLADQLQKSKRHQPQMDVHFSLLEDWLNLTLFEVIRGKPGQLDRHQLAESLGRTVDDIEKTLATLIHCGLIEENEKGFSCKKEHISFVTPIPKETIRKSHKALIERSLKSLESDHMSERNFGSYIFGMDSARYDELCRRIEETMDEFVIRQQDVSDFDRVYSLCFQFFPVTKRMSV